MKNVFEEIDEYKEELRLLSKRLEKEMEKLPKGRLRVAIKANRANYYHCESGEGTSGTKGIYLGKKKEKMIKGLAQKDYTQRLMKEVTSQLSQLEENRWDCGQERLIDVFESMPEYRRKYINPIVKPATLKIAEWESIPFEPLGFGPDDPEYYTEKKERVRSKSEKFIADKLFHMGIPYKYECPINLVGYGTVYPDFTILNKHTMEIVWLEHCGRMGDADYSAKMVAKVRSYEKAGIYVGRNLYLTFETLETPFDARSIETIFEKFA